MPSRGGRASASSVGRAIQEGVMTHDDAPRSTRAKRRASKGKIGRDRLVIGSGRSMLPGHLVPDGKGVRGGRSLRSTAGAR